MTTKTLRIALLLGFGLVACSAGTNVGGPTSPPEPEGQVTVPSGLQVQATISAATLGDACGGGGGSSPPQGGIASDCAEQKLAPGADGGAGSPTTCGGSYSGCQQSNLQLNFTTGAGSKKATVEMVSVVLLDDSGQIDSLTSSLPQSWDGSKYATWDQTISPSSQLKASYNLTAPAWSRIGTSYGKNYKVRVTLRVDGANLVLESAALHREPQVAT